ncbi:hypothetical protein [Erythrobacter sp. A6_0]|uniref:hypothetical protein n=1 Tax=Erythrobacter sp. A6_0 TaxID=2821089 RepID=UPI001ADB9D3A|nr:hypothetical protein [Erythrobacter sp. A6_0]MBO9511687.1 hypothetical protein [Erythrobacter sp. A6_0]
MGDDASEPVITRPSLEGTLLSETFEAIAGFYKLKNADAFDDLTEYLVALSCRDQEGEEYRPFSDPEAAASTSRRSDGHAIALRLRDHATQALKIINAIDEDLKRFDAVVNLHPPLLEAIFDLDLGDPKDLTVPPEIGSLLQFFGAADFKGVELALSQLEAIPVRNKLLKGPMPNVTLRRAVAACRHYWRGTEGHSWSMSSLKEKAVRDENNRQFLQGKCEGFVSDILTQCGIVFGLHELCSAWSAVDKS